MAEKVLREAPPRFALAGHSMGGRVALEVLRRAPERVAALALLDTGVAPLAAGEAGEREAAGRHELLALAREQGMAAMAARWVQGMVWAPRLSDTALVQGVIDMFARRSADMFAAQIRALLARPDAGSLLAGIRCPTLVLCGEQDSWAPAARHREMAEKIPGATTGARARVRAHVHAGAAGAGYPCPARLARVSGRENGNSEKISP